MVTDYRFCKLSEKCPSISVHIYFLVTYFLLLHQEAMKHMLAFYTYIFVCVCVCVHVCVCVRVCVCVHARV